MKKHVDIKIWVKARNEERRRAKTDTQGNDKRIKEVVMVQKCLGNERQRTDSD